MSTTTIRLEVQLRREGDIKIPADIKITRSDQRPVSAAEIEAAQAFAVAAAAQDLSRGGPCSFRN